MPDSTIYSHSNDGVIYKNHVVVGGARLSSTGTVESGDNTNRVGIDRVPAGRGATYTYYRAFYFFDLGSESGTVDSADLKVYQAGNATVKFRAVEWGSSSSSLATGDFDSVFTSGSGASAVMTAYSAEVLSSGSASYDTYTINSDGISAIQSAVGSGLFRVAIVSEEDYDGNLSITQDYFETMTFANSVFNKPKLEITYTTGVTYNAPFLGANF